MEKLFINILSKFKRTDALVLTPAHKEIIRKSIHCLIALVPFLAAWNIAFTLVLVLAGTAFYAFVEYSRINGLNIFLISDITLLVSRDKDKTRFVYGPVTLGLGAILTLLLFPNAVAGIAICALAFGDSAASIIGKSVPSVKLPYSRNKSLSGTIACLAIVFFSTLKFTRDPLLSLPIAVVAALIESLPTGDLDNILLPLGTGIFAFFLMYHFI
jgi:phytol kinase